MSQGGISLEQIDDRHYRLIGLSALTGGAGQYRLLLNMDDVTDESGNFGNETREILWTRVDEAPFVEAIDGVAQSLRNTPLGSVVVTFSEPLISGLFTRDDITLARDEGNNLVDGGVSIVSLDNQTFRIDGLNRITTAEGQYALTVHSEGVTDLDGWMGYGQPTWTWTADATGPVLTATPGFVDDVTAYAVDRVRLDVSEPIQPGTFSTAVLSLWCNGTEVPLPEGVRVTALDREDYDILGLAAATGAGGNYELRIDGSHMRDLAGNVGYPASIAWFHDTVAPNIPQSFGLSPETDLGVFNNDGTTTLQHVTLVGTIDESHLGVEIRDLTTGVLLGSTTAGDSSFTVPVTLATPGAHQLHVTLRDRAGNTSVFVQGVFVDVSAPGVASVELTKAVNASRPTQITMQFSENVNMQQLIAGGAAGSAVTLCDATGTIVALPNGSFTYDADQAVLHVSR